MTRFAHVLLAIVLLSNPAVALAQLRAELLADGFLRPVAVVADPMSPDTLIVAEHRGLFWAVVGGVRQTAPFLDITTEVKTDGNEQGVLGLAFHPSGDRVFVSFTQLRTPDDGIGNTVVRRYRRSAGDPLVLDPATRKDLVWPDGNPFIHQTTGVHRGGDMHFLPDGRDLLYIGLGDGGAFAGAMGAQNPQSLRGKMLRIDVNVPDDHPRGYVVPPDNPFVDGTPISALPEIWAFGFRNPWRWSFDDFGEGRTGAMIIGDVGEGSREEINYEPYGRGGRNYGWFMREGSIPTPNVPQVPPPYTPLTPPMADYGRDIGRSVTGGFVYRGAGLAPFYHGRYIVADFYGRVFSLGLTIGPDGEARVADYVEHTAELGSPRFISTFGRDLNGELYFTTFGGGTGNSARILKIVPGLVESPAPPVNLASQVQDSTVLLTWEPGTGGGSASGYRLEAGSQPGAADLLTVDTTLSSFLTSGVPDGLYYVRVRALNASGTSAPSNEVEVRVGCFGPPAAPTGLAAEVGAGGHVSVTWDAVPGAASYVLEAGFSPGASDAAVIPAGGTTVAGVVPHATYYARVRAVSSRCGTSAPSAEIIVTVP